MPYYIIKRCRCGSRKEARPMDLWMADWGGPTREEFLPNCIEGMTGEQKYNIYSLERFLNAIERIENEKSVGDHSLL